MGSRPTSGPVLDCFGLRKAFGDLTAVADVGFQIAAGETYGLLGPNGAGKTTTIAMISGLLERDSGDVRVMGEPMSTESTDAKRHIGYVPQDLAIYPDLGARENLRFFGRLYGITGKALDIRVDEVLDIIELRDRADDRSDQYSGGMKRRLNIGIGLLHHPHLLILDEPTVGVDPQSRNAILESVERLGEAGMAVLYTTHYMEEAERLCDRLGIIDRGRLMAEGTQRDLVQIVGEHDRVRLTATGPLNACAGAFREITGVEQSGVADDGIDLIVRDAHGLLPEIFEVASKMEVVVSSVDIDSANLEAVFLQLTGRALRE